MKVLCLDIEGGFGGSSRSLFYSLKALRERIEPTVWCARRGPIIEQYRQISISAVVAPAMPRFTPVAKFSRNIYSGARAIQKWLAAAPFRRDLLAAAEAVDLVHLNHESLIPLGHWLRHEAATPVSLHVRTQPPPTAFSRWLARKAVSFSGLVFISENEQAHWGALAGCPLAGRVIYNIAEPPTAAVAPLAAIPTDDRLKVGALGNFAYQRGYDRLIDVALALRRRDCDRVRFVVAGNMDLTGTLPGRLGRLARRRGTLADYAREMGVADQFVFLGRVENPEAMLAGCDVLIKPSRENNPWGRDLLEAMSLGLPAIGIGNYSKFVESGKTGLLLASFGSETIANFLIEMDRSRKRLHRMGEEAARRVRQYCNPTLRGAELFDFWAAMRAP